MNREYIKCFDYGLGFAYIRYGKSLTPLMFSLNKNHFYTHERLTLGVL